MEGSLPASPPPCRARSRPAQGLLQGRLLRLLCLLRARAAKGLHAVRQEGARRGVRQVALAPRQADRVSGPPAPAARSACTPAPRSQLRGLAGRRRKGLSLGRPRACPCYLLLSVLSLCCCCPCYLLLLHCSAEVFTGQVEAFEAELQNIVQKAEFEVLPDEDLVKVGRAVRGVRDGHGRGYGRRRPSERAAEGRQAAWCLRLPSRASRSRSPSRARCPFAPQAKNDKSLMGLHVSLHHDEYLHWSMYHRGERLRKVRRQAKHATHAPPCTWACACGRVAACEGGVHGVGRCIWRWLCCGRGDADVPTDEGEGG